MSNYKYSLNIYHKSNKILNNFIKALLNLGYTHEWKESSIKVTVTNSNTAQFNGCIATLSCTPIKRDFTFNIDNKWEYEAALAIAAIRDDNKPYVGEYVVSKNKNSYLEGKGLCKIIEVMKDSICFRANIMAVSSLEIACRKATPEEIIQYMKEKYQVPTLPEKWCIKAEEIFDLKDDSFRKWYFNNVKHKCKGDIGQNTGYYFFPNYGISHLDKETPYIYNIKIQPNYILITYEKWKQWYDYNNIIKNPERNSWLDAKNKNTNMCDKKIIGYKLIKEYPGSPKLGAEWSSNVGRCEKYPEFWEPIFAQEIKEKVLIIGSESVKVTISKNSIRFDNNSINISTVRNFYSILYGTTPLDVLSGLPLKLNLDPRTRYIEYGCTNLSLDEIKLVIDTYNELNN